MDLSKLADITFVSADVETVKEEIFSAYEKITGRTLADGDPVRLFLLTIANVIILQRNLINETGKMNLLRYATGDYLDHLGAFLGVGRTAATAARVTVEFTLSAARTQATVIPAGTRVTAGDQVFFATAEDVTIAAGELSGSGTAACTEAGETGNGYAAETLTTLVDPLPYIAAVTNTTESEGGAAEEDDETFRERIRIVPESFSVAGPSGAYEYWAKTASSLISDVYVTSPTPGEVEVRPLLTDGEIPGEEILETVLETLNDTSVRPLTDKVTVLAPEAAEYTLDVTYYIAKKNQAQAAAIRTAVNEAAETYVAWQKAVLGRDINPSELIARLVEAGAKRVEVASPAYTKLTGGEVAVCASSTVTYGGIEDE